jgi:subtilisin family serine protease
MGVSNIAGGYVVVLKENVHAALRGVSQVASEIMARQATMEVVQHFDHGLLGFAVRNVSESALLYLRTHPAVESVHEDGGMSITPVTQQVTAQSQIIPWGVARVGAPQSSVRAGNGSGIVAGYVIVIDTGRPTHPDLTVHAGLSFIRGISDPIDRNGHSTHVCGIAAASDNTTGVVGTAPGARLITIRVLDEKGSGTFSDVAAGIDYVTALKRANRTVPLVANLSLGADVMTTAYNVVDLAVARAIAAGVVVVVAAGNSRLDARLTSPAHVAGAIVVGAYDLNNVFCNDFSNRGRTVTVLAPGRDIQSTWLNGQYASLTGTSMAAPHVAGMVATYLSRNRTATPARTRSAILAAAVRPLTSNPPIRSIPASTTNRSAWQGLF